MKNPGAAPLYLLVLATGLGACDPGAMSLHDTNLKGAQFQRVLIQENMTTSVSAFTPGGWSLTLDPLVPLPTSCPVLHHTTVTVNGIAAAQSTPGAAGAPHDCPYSSMCVTSCVNPQWTLPTLPAGPLSIVASDSSQTIEFDVGDMAAAREISVLNATNASPGTQGSLTLAWAPSSDPLTGWSPLQDSAGYGVPNGLVSVEFRSSGTDAGSFDQTWTGYGGDPAVDGGTILVTALFNAEPAGSGGAGTVTVNASSSIALSRCDLPECIAQVIAAPQAQVTWFPY